MITCKQATLFVEKNIENKISFKEKINLRLHLLFCVYCRRFDKQSRLLSSRFNKIEINAALTEDGKKNISEKIK